MIPWGGYKKTGPANLEGGPGREGGREGGGEGGREGGREEGRGICAAKKKVSLCDPSRGYHMSLRAFLHIIYNP